MNPPNFTFSHLHVVDVLVHHPDDLVDLRLLLGHLPGGLDLPHLLRPGDGLAVGAERALARRGRGRGRVFVRHLG